MEDVYKRRFRRSSEESESSSRRSSTTHVALVQDKVKQNVEGKMENELRINKATEMKVNENKLVEYEYEDDFEVIES